MGICNFTSVNRFLKEYEYPPVAIATKASSGMISAMVKEYLHKPMAIDTKATYRMIRAMVKE